VARPPFSITARAATTLGKIERVIGTWTGSLGEAAPEPKLRRSNRVRTVLDTLAIEGNQLTLDQATAVLSGKRVLGPSKEILEIENANRAYEMVGTWNPSKKSDLLSAHAVLMRGLIADAGRFRTKQVGVLDGTRVAHLAPPPYRVADLLRALLAFVRTDQEIPPIVVAVVFHYELELIHPFSDGNGRVGRLWQHALLRRASPIFEHVPTESLIREHQRDYYGALAASDRAGSCDPFLEYMLGTLLQALGRLGGQLRGRPMDGRTRLTEAHRTLGERWFSRKDYLALFPALSTASASRDLARGLTDALLRAQGARALTRYRFR
jgi:Fic family protein